MDKQKIIDILNRQIAKRVPEIIKMDIEALQELFELLRWEKQFVSERLSKAGVFKIEITDQKVQGVPVEKQVKKKRKKTRKNKSLQEKMFDDLIKLGMSKSEATTQIERFTKTK